MRVLLLSLILSMTSVAALAAEPATASYRVELQFISVRHRSRPGT